MLKHKMPRVIPVTHILHRTPTTIQYCIFVFLEYLLIPLPSTNLSVAIINAYYTQRMTFRIVTVTLTYINKLFVA